jgi:hypothetical protein
LSSVLKPDLNFFLIQRHALDNIQARLLIGFWVAAVRLFENHLVFGSSALSLPLGMFL